MVGKSARLGIQADVILKKVGLCRKHCYRHRPVDWLRGVNGIFQMVNFVAVVGVRSMYTPLAKEGRGYVPHAGLS